MYPYNTPGAFVPHSAINLSVKADEAQGGTGTSAVSSLDLTMTEGTPTTGKRTVPITYNIFSTLKSGA